MAQGQERDDLGSSSRGEGLFFPADVVWNGVSPRLTGARLVAPTIGSVLCGAGAATFAVWHGPIQVAWAVPGLVAEGLLTWWWTRRQVRAHGWAERPDELLVRKGVAWRRISSVPYGRMQYVDVKAGPVERALGLASVQLHTASASSDAVIPGLPTADAERLRDQLASRGRARSAGL